MDTDLVSSPQEDQEMDNSQRTEQELSPNASFTFGFLAEVRLLENFSCYSEVWKTAQLCELARKHVLCRTLPSSQLAVVLPRSEDHFLLFVHCYKSCVLTTVRSLPLDYKKTTASVTLWHHCGHVKAPAGIADEDENLEEDLESERQG